MSILDNVKTAMGLNPTHHADLDMQRVLDALDDLDPRPLHKLDAEEARRQPTPADAVKRVMREENIEAPADALEVRDITIPDAQGGTNPARVYKPAGNGPFPTILYFHGGGWVIADLDTYDATPRALAAQTGALVVSAHYRQAPEHKFPAAHEDANAAYEWLLANAATLGADAAQIAVAGESAGGNLAINVAIHARDRGLQAPVHQLLVYPLASTDTDAESYHDSSNAKPLDKETMLWFMEQVLRGDEDKDSPLLRVVDAQLKGLPPATVITAGVDPLRTEGELLAHALTEAGVPVTHKRFAGVTHEFFGMAPVVAAAREAQELAGEHLKRAFGTPAATAARGGSATASGVRPGEGGGALPPNDTSKAPLM